MHFKAENLTIPKHPRLLFLAQNLGVLWPSKSWGHFFWDTLYMFIIFGFFQLAKSKTSIGYNKAAPLCLLLQFKLRLFLYMYLEMIDHLFID